MARILAIDYGTKRIGIAVSDPLKIIATALTTVQANEIFPFLEQYFKREEVDTIVVGDPSGHKKNEAIVKLAFDFCQSLARKFPDKKIDRITEYGTSKTAFQTMIGAGLKKSDRRNKATVDRVSAVILLQDYMRVKSE